MNKDQEILRAAEEEFFDRGYDATSTAVIARKAGVTHAMINYYFRSKQNLFLKIIEKTTKDFSEAIKAAIENSCDFKQMTIDTACVVYDKFTENRSLPFFVLDLVRTRPDLLRLYVDSDNTPYMKIVETQSMRLEKEISEGKVEQCTMLELLDTILILTTSPFLHVRIFEKLFDMTPEQVDEYLDERKKEMIALLNSRYFSPKPKDLQEK